MRYSQLGKTGLTISRIGLGGLPFGGHYGPVAKSDAVRAIRAAVEEGVTFFDTSPSYGAGLAEEILGEALGSHIHEVTVATKVGTGIDSEGHFWPLNTRGNITRQVEESLRRLRRAVIDIYQIHGPDPTTPLSETMEAMEELRRLGKIRAIGFCGATPEILRDSLQYGRIDAALVPYNILTRSIEEELLPFCRAANVAVLACEPYCRGLLTGKFHKNSVFEADDFRIEDRRFRGDMFRSHIESINRLRTLADQEGLTLTQLALAWILQNPQIGVAVCGAKTRLQFRQAVTATGIDLTPDQVMAVDQIVGRMKLQQSE